jgi:hypothetical protein
MFRLTWKAWWHCVIFVTVVWGAVIALTWREGVTKYTGVWCYRLNALLIWTDQVGVVVKLGTCIRGEGFNVGSSAGLLPIVTEVRVFVQCLRANVGMVSSNLTWPLPSKSLPHSAPCNLCLNLLTYLLTHSMVQDITWKADCHSACQKISFFLNGTRRFITVFTKARHWTLS